MRELLITLAAIVVMAIAAKLLDGPVRLFCKAVINSGPVTSVITWYYIRKADKMYPGPKRGPEKREYVMDRLRRWRIKVTDATDSMITAFVSILKNKSGEMKDTVTGKAEDAVDGLVEKITEEKNE